ncbi:MAG: FlgD immunoglobulin-like domain containing protein [Vulcanimicrobiota bacterium]
MHKLSAHRATIYWILVVLIFFIPSISGCGGSGVSNDGVSIGSSGETGAIQDSSREYKTQKALPQDTLAFIEEEGKRYKEYLEKVKNDPNYPGSILDPTKFTQKQIQATPKDTYDPDKYLCFPPGSIYYGLNEIPYMTSSVPFSVPLMFLSTQADNGDRKELPLSGISAKKAHFIVFAGCSTDVPDRHVGTITMSYADGTTNQLELTMGTNVAEWAYDRPELQGHILHSKVPSGYDRTTSQDSNYEYTAHFYYVSIDLQPTELTSMALSMDNDMHQQGDGYFDLIIMSMTLEIVSDLSIENAKATPEKFTPSKKGENNTTNITAQIVANSFQADSIEWQVTIKDETDAIVKTFDTRTGASGSGPWDVSETWDGKNDAGDYIDFGQYSFKISATATSNGIEKKAEATGSIKIIPPIPTLKKLTFENTLDIVYDDGKKVKPVFFNAKKDKNEENPAAISLARLTPVETSVESSSQAKAFFPISKGSCNIVLELYKPDDLSGIGKHGSFTYEVQIFSKDNLLIGSDDKPKEKVYATFEKNSNKAVINGAAFKVPRCVQTINTVKVNYLNVKPSSSGGWEPASGAEWISEPKAAPTENIWITLDDPKPPLGEWEKKKCIRTGLLDIACYLALGSQTSDDVRRKTTKNLYDWLISKKFYYDKKNIHTFFSGETGNCLFKYGLFMEHLPQDKPQDKDSMTDEDFAGDCQDVSCLCVLCCASLGVEMELNKIVMPDQGFVYITNELKTASLQEYAESVLGAMDWYLRQTEYRQWPMGLHQVAALDGLVWDPLLKFRTSPWEYNIAVAAPQSVYKKTLIEKPEEVERASWDENNFKLEKIEWPKKHGDEEE